MGEKAPVLRGLKAMKVPLGQEPLAASHPAALALGLAASLTLSTCMLCPPAVGADLPTQSGSAASLLVGESPAENGKIPPAADLVREAYKCFAWLDDVRSLSIRTESTQEFSRKKETPGGGGYGTCNYLNHLAFDGKRVRNEQCQKGPRGESRDLMTWDGKEGRWYSKSIAQGPLGLYKDLEFLIQGRGYSIFMKWMQIGGSSFWWDPRKGELQGRYLLPEDFVLQGREVFRSEDCWVVQSRAGLTTLYIAVSDRRPRGAVYWVFKPNMDNRKHIRAVKPGIESYPAFKNWLQTLEPTERRRVEGRFYEDAFKESSKFAEVSFSEYREVAPGRWMPMREKQVNWGDGGEVHSTSQTRTVEARIDEPLEDSLFRFDIAEGMKVNDYRFDLPGGRPLEYDYRSAMTEDDLQKLVAAAKAKIEMDSKEEEERLAPIKARLGQKPLDLPETAWLNSKPLAWKDMEGKVVLLDFWAHWCEPCKGEFQMYGDAMRRAEQNGFQVIGVHAAGSELKDIEKAAREHGLKHPLCVDTRDVDGKGLGTVTSWFGIAGIPYAIVVDRKGRVAAHGRLPEMLLKARDLAKSP